MRCPKCSCISFDHLLTCSKCGRDLSSIANELHGTSVQVEAPQLLSPAFEALSGAKSSENSVDEKDTEFRFEEEIAQFDLGWDNTEETDSLESATDDEVEIDLEQALEDVITAFYKVQLDESISDITSM